MKKIGLMLLCCFIAFSAAACGKDKDTEDDNRVVLEAEEDIDYPVEIGDSVVKEKPKSVVSLSPSLTEIIFDLGYEGKLVGVSEFCNYPEGVEDIDRVGNSKTIDFSQIKSLKPDVVFTSTKLTDLDVVALEELGAAVVYIPPVEDFEDVFELYDSIGMVLEGETTGKEEAQKQYRGIKEKLEQCEKAVAEYLEGEASPVTAAYVAEPKTTVATGDSFVGNAMEYIYLENVADSYENWVFPEGQQFSPQLLIYAEDIPTEKIKEYYAATPAVANGFLYTLNIELFERQGFRMLEELIGIAKYAYSDADFAPEVEAQPQAEVSVEQPAEDAENQ